MDCCGRFHRGVAAAPTAVALMRSRYSAFVLRNADYLVRTWHPRTRPARVEFDPRQRWTGLEVVAHSGGGLFDQDGTVEFHAHYAVGKRAGTMHARCRFTRADGAWYYVDDE